MTTRPFPQSIEAERALLGGLILDPDQIEDVTGLVSADDFARPDHAALFELIRGMRARGEKVDSITVPERVVRGGHDDRFGGLGYVLGLPDAVPSTTNLDHYAGVVAEKAQLRRIIVTAQKAMEQAYTHDAEPAVIRESVTRDMSEIGTRGANNWISYADAVDAAVVAADEASRGVSTMTLATHSRRLNEALGGGLPTKEVTIIAGRPAMGKSSLARCIFEHIGKSHGVGVFALESTTQQVGMLALADECGIPMASIRSGDLEAEQWDRIMAPGLRARGLDVCVSRLTDVSLDDIRAEARALNARRLREGKGPIKALVIDYLQLIRVDRKRGESTNDMLEGLSRGLKMLAVALDVALVLLCQLNRELEKRSDKRPIAADLRGSGGLEQDARVLLFPFRPHAYDPDADPREAEIGIAKSTYTGTGIVPMRWTPSRTRYDDLEDPVDAAVAAMLDSAEADEGGAWSTAEIGAELDARVATKRDEKPANVIDFRRGGGAGSDDIW